MGLAQIQDDIKTTIAGFRREMHNEFRDVNARLDRLQRMLELRLLPSPPEDDHSPDVEHEQDEDVAHPPAQRPLYLPPGANLVPGYMVYYDVVPPEV